MTRILVAALAILVLSTGSLAQTGSTGGTGTDTYGTPATGSAATQTDPQATTPTTTSETTTQTTDASTLPSTAGPWPMIALLGLGALGGGVVVRRICR